MIADQVRLSRNSLVDYSQFTGDRRNAFRIIRDGD